MRYRRKSETCARIWRSGRQRVDRVANQWGLSNGTLHGIPRRAFTPQVAELAPINWRRGLFRVWLLISAGWVMSWAIYLIMGAVRIGYTSTDFLVLPVLLFGPPVALLIFGVAAGWAFRGFRIYNDFPKA